jgi:hypothetical protein
MGAICSACTSSACKVLSYMVYSSDLRRVSSPKTLVDIFIGFLAVLLLLRYLSGSHSSLFIVVIGFTRTIMGIVDNTSENSPFLHESLSYPIFRSSVSHSAKCLFTGPTQKAIIVLQWYLSRIAYLRYWAVLSVHWLEKRVTSCVKRTASPVTTVVLDWPSGRQNTGFGKPFLK